MSSNSLTTLSYAARRELIERVAPLYREASLAQKGLVLDRMVAMTGYARKYAIHLLNHAPAGKRTIQRRRQPRYGSQVQHVLLLAWKAAKYICAKRLEFPHFWRTMEEKFTTEYIDRVSPRITSCGDADTFYQECILAQEHRNVRDISPYLEGWLFYRNHGGEK